MPHPPLLTRAAYYASLPVGTRWPYPKWTEASALRAGVLFVQEEGRLPRGQDFRAAASMPRPTTIAFLFTSIAGYHDAVARAIRGDEEPPYQPPPLQPGRVRCLRCERWWESPDRCLYHICPTCQRQEDEEGEDGGWMNGVPVPLRCPDGFDDWEEVE